MDLAAYHRRQTEQRWAETIPDRRQTPAEIRKETDTTPAGDGHCPGVGLTIDELLGTHDLEGTP